MNSLSDLQATLHEPVGDHGKSGQDTCFSRCHKQLQFHIDSLLSRRMEKVPEAVSHCLEKS